MLAKPNKGKAVVIKKEKSKEFIENFNKNVVSKDFLDDCAKTSRKFFKNNGRPINN